MIRLKLRDETKNEIRIKDTKMYYLVIFSITYYYHITIILCPSAYSTCPFNTYHITQNVLIAQEN